ncbi:hypothetical protein ERO13_D01G061101v2 [Gossypium hirsutum]|nr:hypothetical protein ERO13_D01G061101v2 [Gossypium hirsutum]
MESPGMQISRQWRQSPLSIAISMRLTNFAARIIDFNPETLDDIGHNGQTPLHVAIKRNDFDSIVAYIKDNNKKIPLYLAAEKGSIGMVDESQHNLLDLAAMNGNVDAVKYSLNLVEMEDLMNSPDVDGNTALHLAATNYHSDVVTVLSEKTNVKVRAVKFLQFSLPNTTTQLSWRMADMIGIMFTLLATFTFTAAFNIPGRFKNDEPNAGMAVLISKAAFKAFVISDSIAMTSSITAAVIVFWTSSPMAIAFVSGLFVVIQKTLWLATLVCVIGCAAPVFLYIFAPIFLLVLERVKKSGTSHSQRQFIFV